MPARPILWTPAEAAEWIETRREPQRQTVAHGEFQVVSLLSEAELASAAAMLRERDVPDCDGAYRRRDVKKAFPPRRGRPPSSSPKAWVPEGAGVDPTSRRRFIVPSAGRVERLAKLVLDDVARDVAGLAAAYSAKVLRRTYTVQDPRRSGGFSETLKIALDALERNPSQFDEDADVEAARARARAWKARLRRA